MLYTVGDTSLLIQKIMPQQDGTNLVLGYMYKESLPYDSGGSFIAKTDIKNKVTWVKFLSASSTNLVFYDAVILKNSTICVLASTNFTGAIARWIFTLDTNGTLLSVKNFRFNVPNRIINSFKILETESNKIMILAVFDVNNIITGGVEQWFAIAKCSYLGVVDWSISYKSSDSYTLNNFVAKNNNIYLVFNIANGHHLVKINSTNGAIIKSKSFIYQNLPQTVGLAFPTSPDLISNGDSTLTCYTYRYIGYDTFRSVFQFDTLLNIKGSKLINIKNFNPRYQIQNGTIDTTGSVLISAINIVTRNKILIAYLDKYLEVKDQKEIQFNSTPKSSDWINIGAYPVFKNGICQLYNRSYIGGKFVAEIMEASLSNTSTICSGKKVDSIEVRDFTFDAGSFIFNFGASNITDFRTATFTLDNVTIRSTQTCIEITNRTLSCGNDLSICKGDTAIIKATGGFFRYNWYTNYNQRQLNDSAIKVWPTKDTSYVVSATTGSGCILLDTVFIKVKQAYSINLGGDTSICNGDSLQLSVGNSFVNTKWNTGSVNSTIIVKNAGTFFVRALNGNGCYSNDTIKIISIPDTPKVVLNTPLVLCINQNDTLDPGPYKNYLWQDGSKERLYKVTKKGTYSVRVTDNNGCKGKATITVDSLVYKPADFLNSDTVICKYQSVTLSPQSSYSDYLWSTGSTRFSIHVRTAGIYSLEVTDQFNCKGYDTTIVSIKSCQNKIIFPNAFSPDNNGLNDNFKPYIEGVLVQYRLTIFNRWGEEIFKTSDPLSSWDGTYKNIPQQPGLFTWQCSYRFEGEEAVFIKGQLILIK